LLRHFWQQETGKQIDYGPLPGHLHGCALVLSRVGPADAGRRGTFDAG
jgi:hypothetical protein